MVLVLLLEPPYSILKSSGTEVDPLPWDATTIKELYEQLVCSEKFSAAYSVACFPNSGKMRSEVHDLSLVDHLVQQPKTPPLLRAHILQWKATLALKSGNRDEWISLSNEAESIFRAEGHHLGALEIEMERLHEDPLASVPYDELKAATIRIRDAFIKRGAWIGAKDCMMNLSTMAIERTDTELISQLNEQYEQIRADCMTKLDWADKEELMLRYWDYQKQHAAKLMATFEELYQVYVNGDMPARGALVAVNLYKLYRDLGDDRNAKLWAERVAEHAKSGPLLQLHLFHPLIRRHENHGTTALPIDEEMAELTNFLRDKTARYAEDIARFERTQILRSIFQVHASYFVRPFHEYKRLSSLCCGAIRSCLPLLPPHDRAIHEAQLLDTEGGVLFLDALQQVPAAQDVLIDAYNTYADAAGILESIGERGLPLSGSYAGIGQAAENLWMSEVVAANWGTVTDPFFLEAFDFYYTSLTIAAECEISPAIQLAIYRLHDLWLRGLNFNIGVHGKEHETSIDAMDETICWLGLGKTMLEAARRDSSTLSKSSAVLGKQSVRATLWGTKLYENAFELAMVLGSPKYLWEWLQDSKARSASDLLALGINIPETLRDEIGKSESSKLLFDEEISLREQLDTADGASLIILHQQLENLRARMALDELADAVLALREGRPTTLEALQTIAQKDAAPASSSALIRSDTRLEKLGLHRAGPTRRVFFVDYGFHKGDAFALVALGADIKFVWLKTTILEIAKWRDHWLTHRSPEPETPGSLEEEDDGPEQYNPRLREGEDAGLSWLSRLAQPLVSFSSPGDLLVLCPSENLHGIPIHAAKISPGNEGEPMCLIERNPVVYTASMTMTEQCMARATSTVPSPLEPARGSTGNTILSAFRYPQEICAMASRISQHFPQPPAMHIGTHLPLSTVQTVLASSKTVLFLGHCSTGTGTGGVADQYLLLADPDPDVFGSKSHLLLRKASESSASPLPASPPPPSPPQHPIQKPPPPQQQDPKPPNMSPSTTRTPTSTETPSPTPETETRFTIPAIFSTPITASLIALIACGSASQAIRTGDEPTGLLTALLCSGANSVVGSLWPVEARAGVAFAEGFLGRLAKLQGRAGDVGGENGDGDRDGRGDGGELGGGIDTGSKKGNGEENGLDGERGPSEANTNKLARLVDLAVVLQETVVELKRSRRMGFSTGNVVDWGAFTLNGAWLLDVLDADV